MEIDHDEQDKLEQECNHSQTPICVCVSFVRGSCKAADKLCRENSLHAELIAYIN